MKVLIAAGGSGGHIFPAISLAEELEKRASTAIIFAASKRSIDQKILEKAKFKKYFFSINPMPYRIGLRFLRFGYNCIIDFFKSLWVLFVEQPAIVVGFGGYTSGMIVLLARFFNVRTVIHEQNIFPGRANVMLDRIVTSVAVTFDESVRYFKNKNIVVTGNPLRKSLITCDKKTSFEKLGSKDKSFFTLLVIGGSQGARSLNNLVVDSILKLDKGILEKLQIVHIAGADNCDFVSKTYNDNNINASTFSFVENIHDAYNVADLVISRSGSAAIFEIALYAKPMILIPYPHKKNSQRLNAKYFSDRNAAICLEEENIKDNKLRDIIRRLVLDKSELQKLSESAKRLANPNADKLLANEVLRLIKNEG